MDDRFNQSPLDDFLDCFDYVGVGGREKYTCGGFVKLT